MSKKWIISLSVIFGVIAILLILFWTLFALKHVEINFLTSTKNLTISQEEIVEAGQFRFGASVLFEGKQKYVDKLQNMANENENFAYLKVINIETKFPNKFIIHVAEREELFAVQNESKFLICDREFRVLKILDNFTSQQNNAILLNGLQFDGTAKVGDFLDIKQSGMLKFYSALVSNNRSLALMQGKFKSITLGKNVDEFTNKQFDCITLESFAGRSFVINNISFALASKFQKLFAAESALFAGQVDESTGNIISSINADGSLNFVWLKKQNGCYVSAKETDEGAMPLSLKLLQNCQIVVDNLTLSEHVHRTENDVYYFLREI